MSVQTLAQLRTAVRQRADMVNSTFITDSELNGYINNSIAELYDLILQKYGNDYFVSSSNFNLVSGTDSYTLPADFLKLIGVDLALASNDFITLKPFMFSERNRYTSTSLRGYYGASFYRYRLRGNNIIFNPIPNVTNQITVWYVPRPTTLTSDSDTFDGYNGWEEYVIVDAAIKCLQKEESDVSVLLAQKKALEVRIEEAAGNRDAGFSPRIVDTRRIELEGDREFFEGI